MSWKAIAGIYGGATATAIALAGVAIYLSSLPAGGGTSKSTSATPSTNSTGGGYGDHVPSSGGDSGESGGSGESGESGGHAGGGHGGGGSKLPSKSCLDTVADGIVTI